MQPPQSIQFSCKLVCVFRSLHAFCFAYAALVSIIVLHILIFFNMNYVKKFADIQKNMMLFIHIFLIYSGKPLKFLFFFRANTFRQKKKESSAPLFLTVFIPQICIFTYNIHYSTGVGLAGSKMSLASNKSDKRL